MSVIAGDVFQTQVIGTCFGQVIRHVRTWFIDSVTGGLIPDASAFQTAILTDTTIGAAHDKVTPYLDCLSQSYTAKQYQAQKISPTRYYRASVDLPGGTVGSRGIASTGNLQCALNVNGVFGGRRYRTSYKIGPLSTADSVAGLIHAGCATAVATYAESFLLPLAIVVGAATAVLYPAILHPGTTTPHVAATADQIVAYAVRAQTRVKGTRSVGYGE